MTNKHHRLFYRDKPIAGVDISTTGVKIMAIKPSNMSVTGYGAIDLDPRKVQDSLTKSDDYLASGLKQLLDKQFVGHLPSNHVAVSIPTNRTYSRTLNLPRDAETNLDEAVRLEAEQYIPIPVGDLYIDSEVIEHANDTLTVLISAVPKKIVESIVETCYAAGLEVVMAEPGINAASRMVTVTERGQLPSVVIDVGAATTDVALLDGVVRVTGGVAVGGHTFTLKISDKLKVGLEEAHQLKIHSGLANGPRQSRLKSALQPGLDEIVTEARKIVRYYAERLGAKTKVEQVIIVGGGSNMPGLGDYMTDALQMPARIAEPWHALRFGKLPVPSRQFKPRYITAAGLSVVPPKEIWS